MSEEKDILILAKMCIRDRYNAVSENKRNLSGYKTG